MKTLYIECSMGASGDMLLAALLGLTDNPREWVNKLNTFVPAGVSVFLEEGETCGLKGYRVRVTVNGHEENTAEHHAHHHHSHHHTDLKDIEGLIEHLSIPPTVKADAAAVYRLLAEAESGAHGRPVDLVHFHEVGALDAVADIVCVCFLIDALSIDRIVASPIHVGSGTVECAHGMMPVPAPATVRLLHGVPIYGGKVSGELCTPTGAVLLKHFAQKFASLPSMMIERSSMGIGSKDFSPYPNCLRLFLGEESEGSNDLAAELCCNIDDMTGEEIGFAVDILFKEKALDVFTLPAQMKKNRPGVLLTVLCPVLDADRFAVLLFKYTSTFGVRKRTCERYVLKRNTERRETPYGPVEVKSGCGYGICKEKLEYRSAAELAANHGMSLRDIMNRQGKA